MVQYWIATTNWYGEHLPNRPCSGAKDRNERQIWWYLKGRDKIELGDKAIIYAHSGNIEADKEQINIDEKLKKCFIGYFTIDKIFENKNPLIPNECWSDNDPNGGWIKIKDHSLYPQNKIIKREDFDNLLLKISKKPNVGLVFRNKTWIKITKEYYDLVMQRLSH